MKEIRSFHYQTCNHAMLFHTIFINQKRRLYADVNMCNHTLAPAAVTGVLAAVILDLQKSWLKWGQSVFQDLNLVVFIHRSMI